MRKGTIDRFEGEYAIVEFGGSTEDILRSELPSEAGIGDVLIFADGVISVDHQETKKRKKEINDLMDELFED